METQPAKRCAKVLYFFDLQTLILLFNGIIQTILGILLIFIQQGNK